jgi:hypothetical protein
VGIEPAVCTEIAAENANIGWFYMEIAVEKYFVAVKPFLDTVGKTSHKTEAGVFK